MKEFSNYNEFSKDYKKNYPHVSINDVKIAYFAYTETLVKIYKKQAIYNMEQNYSIREGYHKRMTELIDLIDRMLKDPDNNIKPIYAKKFKDAQ